MSLNTNAIEPDRAAALGIVNACASIAEEKPSHVSHAGRGERRERRFERLACVGPPNTAVGAPGVGAEIDSVVDPGQICPDQERARTIIEYRVHPGSVRSRRRSGAGHRLRGVHCLAVRQSAAKHGRSRPAGCLPASARIGSTSRRLQTGWRCSGSINSTPRVPHSSARTPPGRIARTQFYIAYSYYRSGWGRLYNDDEHFKRGLEAIERAIALAPGGRLIVDDPENHIHNADELRAELAAGLRTEAGDLNPLRLFRNARK